MAKSTLSALGRIGIVIGVAVAFLFGLAGTVYLSLRSKEVKVPDVIGKNRLAAESALSDSGLNIRVRATRPSADTKPDTVLVQLPRSGEVVKSGQTVAVDVSRAAKEGESAPSTIVDNKAQAGQQKEGQKANEAAATDTQKANDSASANNQNKQKRNKNSNNANSNGNRNVNNRNTSDRNANDRGANTNRNVNANRNANAGNRNANLNVNRNSNNLNVNRRSPVISTPPFANPTTNRPTP